MLKLIEHKIFIFFIAFGLVMILSDSAYAAAFSGLTSSGKTIFEGLRSIIYPASAIGIICVCIGGFFGNINWKWLTAVMVGLLVIAFCGTVLGQFLGNSGEVGNVAATIKDGS